MHCCASLTIGLVVAGTGIVEAHPARSHTVTAIPIAARTIAHLHCAAEAYRAASPRAPEGGAERQTRGAARPLLDNLIRPLQERLREGHTVEGGTHDDELGFAKVADHWRLAVRTATYRNEGGRVTLLSTNRSRLLLAYSRDIRIEALRHFPALAARMKQEADAAVKAITDAKKFVK
jgi:hypothetical protein